MPPAVKLHNRESQQYCEGADLVEGRCLGSWQRVERQPDHRSSGNKPIHGLPGAQTTGGRRLRGRVERSEEHTSELQSQSNLVCRLLLEKKKNNKWLIHM